MNFFVLLFRLTFSSFTWAVTPGVTDTEIRIGGHTAESGALAMFAPGSLGAAAYFDQLNEKGGVNGRKIKFIRIDTQGDQLKSVQATKKLVEEDQIFANFCSVGKSHLSVYKYLIEKDVPDVFFSDTLAEYGTPFKKTVFPGKASLEAEALTLLKIVVDKHKGSKVCFFSTDDQNGEEFYQGVKKGIEEANLKLSEKDKLKLGPYERVSAGAVQANTQVTNLKRSNCDVVFSSPSGALGPNAISYGILQKFEPTWLLTSTNATPKFIELIPEGHRDGFISLTSVAYEDFGAPGWDAYKSLMEKAHVTVGRSSANSYSFAEIFTEAVRRAGKDLTRENLIKSLESLNGWKCSLCVQPLVYSSTNHWGFSKSIPVISKGGKWVKY